MRRFVKDQAIAISGLGAHTGHMRMMAATGMDVDVSVASIAGNLVAHLFVAQAWPCCTYRLIGLPTLAPGFHVGLGALSTPLRAHPQHSSGANGLGTCNPSVGASRPRRFGTRV